ncbi:MAG: hypothetical protein DMG57_13070 [Acidobacteria bacterium]|nr:MAG: hypothetical protein DMG57_13070 [Acidobacteriota bacterium]
MELLRCYWRKVRPGEWMFPGQNPNQPLSREAVGDAVAQASRRAGPTKHTTPHSMRHATYSKPEPTYAKFNFCLVIAVSRPRPAISAWPRPRSAPRRSTGLRR